MTSREATGRVSEYETSGRTKTMSWQDYGESEEQDDEPAITLGDLRDGETVTLAFRAEPETFESDYGEAVRVEATFLESDYKWQPDDADEPVTNGDNVVLVTWSKRLVSALAEQHDAVGIVGEAFRIIKTGSGYETDYSVEHVDGSDD